MHICGKNKEIQSKIFNLSKLIQNSYFICKEKNIACLPSRN